MKKLLKITADIIEVYIPAVMLMVLFASFVVGVFFRYVLKNPQSWTYETSSIAFLSFTVLSICYVQRMDEHIEFDMLFNKMSPKIKCAMTMISNLITAIICAFLTPASVRFVISMKGLNTQMLNIPRGLVYCCMIILFASTFLRTAIRFGKGAAAYRKGNY